MRWEIQCSRSAGIGVQLRRNTHRSEDWNDDEVVQRWKLLFRGNLLVDRLMKNECSCDAEAVKAQELIGLWRERLSDVSWFMRCLNEHIAREANREDGCKGRFWEGRFKSQALLDEAGLLACMAYVDLNPIRAGLCESPEASDFTSIQARIRDYMAARDSHQDIDLARKSSNNKNRAVETKDTDTTPNGTDVPSVIPLASFNGSLAEGNTALPFEFADYLELVDWTGRAVHPEKRGAIPEGLPPIPLNRFEGRRPIQKNGQLLQVQTRQHLASSHWFVAFTT